MSGQGHDIFGMQIGEQGNQAFGGVGQRLVPMGDPSHNDAYQNRPARELACKFMKNMNHFYHLNEKKFLLILANIFLCFAAKIAEMIILL